MAELFLMCPDCGLRAKLTDNTAKVLPGGAKCRHRQNPLKCPILMPLISSLMRPGRENHTVPKPM